jgi:hypothetical protein
MNTTTPAQKPELTDSQVINLLQQLTDAQVTIQRVASVLIDQLPTTRPEVPRSAQTEHSQPDQPVEYRMALYLIGKLAMKRTLQWDMKAVGAEQSFFFMIEDLAEGIREMLPTIDQVEVRRMARGQPNLK